MKTLLYPILFSIFAGFFILIIPKRFSRIGEGFSLLSCVYLFVGSIIIFLQAPIEGRFLFVDGLSKFIVLAIGFFGMLVTLYSLDFMVKGKDNRSYYAYIIWTIGFSILSAVSNNIILLLVAWGFLGLTLYMLINLSGAVSSEISKKTFIIVGGSDTFMLMGFAILWCITGSLSLSNIKIAINDSLSFWAFLLIAMGAFAKAGVVPLHTWVPDTARYAPIPVTAFLPASLDKLLGIYLLARLVLDVFILDSFSSALLMLVGAITIIVAVMLALVQHDFKKLLGYHAVSQVGYMVLGLGTGNPIGIAGGLFHMLNNAIYKCCLFLSGGNIEYRAKTSELDRLGGLCRVMPITFFTTLVASFAISGIPPFNGFFSKWMIYQGLIEKGSSSGGFLWIFCIILAMVGSGLTLASFIKLLHSVFLGKSAEKKIPAVSSNLSFPRSIGTGADLVLRPKITESRTPNPEPLSEVSWHMWFPPLILAIVCIIFGVWAYSIPLKHFIIPAVPGSLLFIGSWQCLKATLFLIIGLGVGILIYLLGNFKGIRETNSYIGGEKLEDEMKISGTEFYGMIKELPVLKGFYRMAEKNTFDIYEQGKRLIFSFTRIFQYLHNGVLPTYLVWCLLGMMILLFSILK